MGFGVSVIIPCLNAARYLGEAVESVLMQEHAGRLQVIVADDGSTDESLRIAASFEPRVCVLARVSGLSQGPMR